MFFDVYSIFFSPVHICNGFGSNECSDYTVRWSQSMSRWCCTTRLYTENQEDWVEGERDFFWDKCKELGLDPDFFAEDVGEDDSSIAQYFSHLSKSGKYFDPVVFNPASRK
ncbi:hypothetical protein HanPSC8_Chr03g0092451 [Helianthus annuus]|nr:hypothetical protein HanPSC8_Chr03g0092451 [Helianthus annuus]